MIETHEISALMRSVSKAIDERVADRTRDLEAKNAALQKAFDDLVKQVDALPKEGIVGPMGPQGERGMQGPAGESVVGPQGPQGEKGLQGAPGERGGDGAIGPKGDTGERGEKGAEGPQGPQGVMGSQGEPGQRGEAGARGEKGDRGDAGQVGERGLQGERGEAGRDAAEIHPLPEIEPGKRYARGVWVRHAGGLVRSDGAGGWDVMQNGISSIVATQHKDDPRLIQLCIITTDKESETYNLRIPMQIYRGIFKADKTYEQGDTVTWDGSLWHKNTQGKVGAPGKSECWQLCVKRGQNGKDGKGEKGDKGDPGENGRDLRYK